MGIEARSGGKLCQKALPRIITHDPGPPVAGSTVIACTPEDGPMEDKDKSREELLSELTHLRDQLTLPEDRAAHVLPPDGSSIDPTEPAHQIAAEHGAEWTNHDKLERTTRLLQAMNAAQNRFITNGDPKELFDGLLSALLSVTESQYGFIDEVHSSDEGALYRQVRAITNIAWNEETRAAYEELDKEGFKFFNLNTLTGAVVTSGEPVISTILPTILDEEAFRQDILRFILSWGYLWCQEEHWWASWGLQTDRGGYSQYLADFLTPYLDTCANIIMAYRNEQRRKDAEEALRDERERLEKRVEERTADLRKANAMLQGEIAERKRVAQALSESELRYRTVFENAEDAILLMEFGGRPTGSILSANQAAARIHGYTVDELVGMNIRDLDPHLSPDRVTEVHNILLSGSIYRQRSTM